MQIADRRTRVREATDEDDPGARQGIDADVQRRFAAMLNTTVPASPAEGDHTAALAGASRPRHGRDRFAWCDAQVAPMLHLPADGAELTVRLTNGPFAGIEVTVWRHDSTVRGRVKSAPDSRFGTLARERSTLSDLLTARLGFPVSIECDGDAAATS